MSDVGFTKGPWHWVDAQNDGPVTKDTWVASLRTVKKSKKGGSAWDLPEWVLDTDGGKGDMSDADAHLIAAAPDLYEALEALERQCVALYRAATPGGNYGTNAEGSDRNESAFADNDPAVTDARKALAKARGEAQ